MGDSLARAATLCSAPSSSSAAAPRVGSAGLRLRERGTTSSREQVDVLGIRSIDRRQDDPLGAGTFQRLQPLRDPHRSAVHDLGPDPARRGLLRGVVVVAAEQDEPTPRARHAGRELGDTARR